MKDRCRMCGRIINIDEDRHAVHTRYDMGRRVDDCRTIYCVKCEKAIDKMIYIMSDYLGAEE